MDAVAFGEECIRPLTKWANLAILRVDVLFPQCRIFDSPSLKRFKTGVKEMAAKIKPVQPTEIKDKKIAREVIEQIRKPIPASVYKRLERNAKYIDKMFEK